jgi:hypothetical protein
MSSPALAQRIGDAEDKKQGMTDEDIGQKRTYRRVQREIRLGQPIQLSEPFEVADAAEFSSLSVAMVDALRAYRNAGLELIKGKYASVRELAPPQLRVPCHVCVICCPDGVLVRYDVADAEEPKMRSTDSDLSISEVAPIFSEHVVHAPDDTSSYVPKGTGPAVVLNRRCAAADPTDSGGGMTELARFYPMVYTSKTLPPDFKLPSPPAKPPCLASVHREFHTQMRGIVYPAKGPPNESVSSPSDHFIAHGIVSLPVGWQAIEIYPRLPEKLWRAEYAPMWAELDLLSVIAQENIIRGALRQLDGRGATREKYSRLIDEFETLLAGHEEPCHQFLKANAELICPTHDALWSKVRFGKHVSDFVFREPYNDYLLVEIEAPHRKLFRKDGHPRQALTHAVSQINDWLSFIHDNKQKVEQEQGLTGIAAAPRTMVVIGRSESLTEENRRTLAVMKSQQPRLTVMTYDDLIARARVQLERLFGPLSIKTSNLDIYYYRPEESGTGEMH